MEEKEGRENSDSIPQRRVDVKGEYEQTVRASIRFNGMRSLRKEDARRKMKKKRSRRAAERGRKKSCSE